MGNIVKKDTHKSTRQEACAANFGSSEVADRLAKLEAEVLAGARNASTLVLVPREKAKAAILTFPRDPFGPPEPW